MELFVLIPIILLMGGVAIAMALNEQPLPVSASTAFTPIPQRPANVVAISRMPATRDAIDKIVLPGGSPEREAKKEDSEMTDAEAKRRVTLLALRDVEYDRVTGKLDERDYQELRREISAEALAALAAEEAERSKEGARTGPGGVIDLEAQIERVRLGLRSGATCRSCGHVNPAGSRFCSSCGSSLTRSPAGAGKGG